MNEMMITMLSGLGIYRPQGDLSCRAMYLRETPFDIYIHILNFIVHYIYIIIVTSLFIYNFLL